MDWVKPFNTSLISFKFEAQTTTRMKDRQIIFVFIVLLFFAGSQILARYAELPDFFEGLLIGTSIGLMLFGLTKKKKQEVSH